MGGPAPPQILILPRALVAAGPALMLHGGTGTNLRTRDTDVGGVLTVGGRLHLAGRLGIEVGLSNYLYGSRYTTAGGAGAGGSAFRHDLLVTMGLVLSWRQ